MTENDRVRMVRKALKLTTTEFGDCIGINNSAVSNIETGNRRVTSQVRLMVCLRFNVSEEWLRTGAGEMFVSEDTISLDDLAKRRGATELELSLLKAYFRLKDETRRDIMNNLAAVFGAENDENHAQNRVSELAKMPPDEFQQFASEQQQAAQEKGVCSTSDSGQSSSA